MAEEKAKGTVERKWTKPNVDADIAALRGSSRFYSLPANSTTRVRILPPAQGSDGRMFTTIRQHFNLKDAEGQDMAPWCSAAHKGEPCPACKVSDHLWNMSRSGDKNAKALAIKIGARARHYIAAYVKGLEEEGPKLIACAPSLAESIKEDNLAQRDSELPLVNDVEQGQWIALRRSGTSWNDTAYKSSLTGQIESLYSVDPSWEEKMFDNMTDTIGPKFVTSGELSDSLERTYGSELDIRGILG